MMISLTTLLCPLVVFAFIVVIIVLIVRSAGRTVSRVAAEAARPPLNVVTQLAPDGFWLSSFEPASIVHYQFWAAGAKHSGQTAFQPGNDGRQFIYTGVRPDEVEIVRVVGPSGDFTSGQAIYADDGPADITSSILGAAAGAAIYNAVASAAQEPPPPPTPPSFPAAY
jgi:hypothetical protein